MSRTVWWVKRDMRINDNEALYEAVQNSSQVLPVFVFEPEIISSEDYSVIHLYAQVTALTELKQNLRSLGSDLLILHGNIIEVLENLWDHWCFDRLYSHQETGNWLSYQRDIAVNKLLLTLGVRWHEFQQNGVIRKLTDRAKRQPIIRQRLFEQKTFAAPGSIRSPLTLIEEFSEGLPELSDYFSINEINQIQFDDLQAVSESSGKECLQGFLTQRGLHYSGGISSPNTAFIHGSRLSVHLAWGTISLRTVYAETALAIKRLDSLIDPHKKKWKRSLNAFRSRLHWHCHFIQRLETVPTMEFKPLNPAYEKVIYENDKALLVAWREGKTGFPLVDACMRCLQATGFLNFRMRAFVVSFAVFGLHLDWRLIHPHLANVFYDYEPGIHFSQLQMQAGIVGINTVRVYSPTKQLIDQDSDCQFVKKWLPELRTFSVADIQSYDTITLGEYPRPVVNFQNRSKQMKDQIFTIRKSLKGKLESAKVLEKHGSRKRSGKIALRQPKKDSPQISLF